MRTKDFSKINNVSETILAQLRHENCTKIIWRKKLEENDKKS